MQKNAQKALHIVFICEMCLQQQLDLMNKKMKKAIAVKNNTLQKQKILDFNFFQFYDSLLSSQI